MIYVTPAQFEDKMNEILDGVIPETIIEAVEIVTEVLCDNGYGEGAAVFSACVKDWFNEYAFSHVVIAKPMEGVDEK